MQKTVRKWLERRREQKKQRKPGYVIQTGVWSEKEVYLVYLLAFTKKKDSVLLTVKKRSDTGERVPVIERREV